MCAHGAATVLQGNTDAFFRDSPGDVPPGKQEDRFKQQLRWMTEQLGPERTEYLATLPFACRISQARGTICW